MPRNLNRFKRKGTWTCGPYLESEIFCRRLGVGDPLEGIIILAHVSVHPLAPEPPLGSGDGDVLRGGDGQAGH